MIIVVALGPHSCNLYRLSSPLPSLHLGNFIHTSTRILRRSSNPLRSLLLLLESLIRLIWGVLLMIAFRGTRNLVVIVPVGITENLSLVCLHKVTRVFPQEFSGATNTPVPWSKCHVHLFISRSRRSVDEAYFFVYLGLRCRVSKWVMQRCLLDVGGIFLKLWQICELAFL